MEGYLRRKEDERRGRRLYKYSGCDNPTDLQVEGATCLQVDVITMRPGNGHGKPNEYKI